MKRLLAFVARHRWVDLVVAVVAGAALGRVDKRWLATSPNRVTIYVALFGAATTLLGFVVGALAVIKGIGEGPRITELRRRHGSTITGAMQGSTWALLALFVVSLGALIAEDGQPGRLSLSLAYWAMVFAALRLVRMAWIVGLILSVGDTDDRLSILKGRRRPIERRSQRRDAS
jgi:hypothetical protein